ncbi:hypothetical protein PPO43_14415 [Saprospira sp. CCB-QB6]|uniref:LolA family protein n=1 Tax=Saprospira sp. CCB-QB6 TaxID=3023936 RepID=UPI00234A48C8|nr:hypothetical protein [Saprospira sp. CCB-QB6]WCL81165.1 hypothetical protein PPO43_14415 [Saprospira sp. CCB-QB6]
MMKYIFALIGLVLQFSLWGQDLKKDYEALEKRYAEIVNFSADIEVDIYDLQFSKLKPLEQNKGFIYKQKDLLHYAFGSFIFLKTAKEAIMVDQEDKMIILQNLQESTAAQEDEMLSKVEEAMHLYDKIEYLGLKEGLKHYKVSMKKGYLMKNMELYIDAEKMLIQRVIYESYIAEMDQLLKVDMRFLNLSTSPKPKYHFSAKQYIEKRSGKYYPVSSYKTYKLINQQSH